MNTFTSSILRTTRKDFPLRHSIGLMTLDKLVYRWHWQKFTVGKFLHYRFWNVPMKVLLANYAITSKMCELTRACRRRHIGQLSVGVKGLLNEVA